MIGHDTFFSVYAYVICGPRHSSQHIAISYVQENAGH